MGYVGKVALKKPSTLLSLGGIFSPNYTFTTQYQAVRTKAIALGYQLPSFNQQILQDQLMQSWITSGLFAKADILYMMANDVGLNFARINWKDPDNYLLTDSGTVSYMNNYGPYTNPESATPSWLSTGWAPSVGVNFTLNSNSVVHSMLSGYAGSGMFYRAGTGGNSTMMYSLDFARFIFNNSATTPTSAASHNNFSWMNRRTASNSLQLMYAVEAGGSTVLLFTDATAVSSSKSTLPMVLLSDSSQVVGPLNTGVPIDAFFAGAALTDTEFINYDLALKTYVNKIRYSTILYTPLGSSNYTVPAGITQLLVECWGAGGAGRGFTNVVATKTGAGGAGGAYAASLINVTPGAVIPIVLGAGGTGGTGAGPAGADTSWNGGVVLAKGGAGGNTIDADHSNGGTAAASVGTTKFSGGGGGSQGTVLNASTGSGGSGAGSLGNGLNGFDGVTAGAVSTRVSYNKLGPGAPGYSQSNAADVNGIPGMMASGGGGARRATVTKNGGNGGQGYIRVSALKSY